MQNARDILNVALAELDEGNPSGARESLLPLERRFGRIAASLDAADEERDE